MATKAKTDRNADLPRQGAKVEELDLAGLDHSIAFALRLAQTASFLSFARRTQQVGLKPGHYAILHLIGANAGIAHTALSRASGRDKSTLTPIIADLSQQGLITRENCERDGRSRRLYLTKTGQKRLDLLASHAAEHDALLDRIIGAENKPQLLEWLSEIVSALENDSTGQS